MSPVRGYFGVTAALAAGMLSLLACSARGQGAEIQRGRFGDCPPLRASSLEDALHNSQALLRACLRGECVCSQEEIAILRRLIRAILREKDSQGHSARGSA
jgi:hypothetical protein